MNGIIKKIGAFLISAVMALGAFSAAFAADERDYSEYYAAMRKRWEDTLTGGLSSWRWHTGQKGPLRETKTLKIPCLPQ